MAVNLFPQNGDTGDETAFQDLARTGTYNFCNESSFKVEHQSGLDIVVPAGVAWIDGVHVELTQDVVVTLPDNTTTDVALLLERSGGLVQNPSSDADLVTATPAAGGSDPLELRLARVTTTSGSVSKIRDHRIYNPHGITYVRGQGAGRTITSSTSMEFEEATAAPAIDAQHGGLTEHQFQLQAVFTATNGGLRCTIPGEIVNQYKFKAWDINADALLEVSEGSRTHTFPEPVGDILIEIQGFFSSGAEPCVLEFSWAQETSDAGGTTIDLNQTWAMSSPLYRDRENLG